MWVQEDQLVLLETNKEQGLVRSASHCSHHNIGPMENVADGFHIALLHLGHAYPAGEDHKTAIPERFEIGLVTKTCRELL